MGSRDTDKSGFFFALSQARRHDKHIARCLFIIFFFSSKEMYAFATAEALCIL